MQRNRTASVQRVGLIFSIILCVGFAFSQAIKSSETPRNGQSGSQFGQISDNEITTLLDSTSVAESANWLDDGQIKEPSRVAITNQPDLEPSQPQESAFSSSFTDSIGTRDDNVLFSSQSK